jgi:hypothetical protein
VHSPYARFASDSISVSTTFVVAVPPSLDAAVNVDECRAFFGHVIIKAVDILRQIVRSV